MYYTTGFWFTEALGTIEKLKETWNKKDNR